LGVRDGEPLVGRRQVLQHLVVTWRSNGVGAQLFIFPSWSLERADWHPRGTPREEYGERIGPLERLQRLVRCVLHGPEVLRNEKVRGSNPLSSTGTKGPVHTGQR